MEKAIPSQFLFRNTESKRGILRTVAKLWGVNGVLTHNPSPNPISLNRENILLLKKNRYVVSEKSDGVRYLLVLGKLGDNNNLFSAMIDRALTIYQVQIFAPSSYFNGGGSLFDGELVWNNAKQCLNFLVFDVVSISGEPVGRKQFLDRYKVLNTAFPSMDDFRKNNGGTIKKAREFSVSCKKIVCIPHPDHPPVFMVKKPCVMLHSLASLSRSMSTLTHDSDGFIFTPIDCPVLKNKHTTMFKWKRKPTIDVQINSDKNIMCMDDGCTVKLSDALPEWDFTLCNLCCSDDTIIEVDIQIKDANSVFLLFHRIRTDKKEPNDKRTISSTLKDIQENITMAELLVNIL
jgi:hypothetical protein